jgi:hypothetical protein
VYTDNGAHFTGAGFHGRLQEKDIKHFPAPKTHPQSVGLSERYVQLLMNVVKRMTITCGQHNWDICVPLAVKALNSRIVRVHGYTPSELLFGFIPRGHKEKTAEDLIIMEGLDERAYGLRLSHLEEMRDMAGERMTKTADAVERASKAAWTPLIEGDLVLLRRFRVVAHHGLKLEPLWEGPYRLVEMSYHGKSGRLQDLITGDIVRTRKGSLREKVHVNDLKLYVHRDMSYFGLPEESSAVDLEQWGRSEKSWKDGWELAV